MDWTGPDGYTISTDPRRLDLDTVHAYLSKEAYWATGQPRHLVERAAAHSLNFGLYDPGGAQVGYARMVTDQATFAWLADVFVLGEHRERGLGKWLVATAMAHPAVTGLRRMLLATHDAHGLYERYGFRPLQRSERFMAIERPAHEP